MPLDIVSTLTHVSKPLRPVCYQELLDQVFGYWIHVLWPLYPTAENLLVNSEWIVVEERWKAGQHLVDQDTKCPPVDGFVVSFALNDLRSQVLRCAA